MALIATGRVAGFVLDGNPGAPTLDVFVAELIIAAAAVQASRPGTFGNLTAGATSGTCVPRTATPPTTTWRQTVSDS